MKNKDIVVDYFNEKQQVRQQLRIKKITHKYANGGNMQGFCYTIGGL